VTLHFRLLTKRSDSSAESAALQLTPRHHCSSSWDSPRPASGLITESAVLERCGLPPIPRESAKERLAPVASPHPRSYRRATHICCAAAPAGAIDHTGAEGSAKKLPCATYCPGLVRSDLVSMAGNIVKTEFACARNNPGRGGQGKRADRPD